MKHAEEQISPGILRDIEATRGRIVARKARNVSRVVVCGLRIVLGILLLCGALNYLQEVYHIPVWDALRQIVQRDGGLSGL